MSTIRECIPISRAMICWNDASDPDAPGAVCVIRWPDTTGVAVLYNYADGASRGRPWTDNSDEGDVEMLLQWITVIAWGIVLKYGVMPSDVHSALLAIKEYRENSESIQTVHPIWK